MLGGENTDRGRKKTLGEISPWSQHPGHPRASHSQNAKVGQGPAQRPPLPIPTGRATEEKQREKEAQQRVSVLRGQACAARGSSEGRIIVFAQLRTALPFPPIGDLREHQVQLQGHQPAALPATLTPSGQGLGTTRAGLAQWESW